MTSPERIVSLCRAVEYLVQARIGGPIVECGVWRGGSMMAVARTLKRLGSEERDLYLFDTFGGMTKPSTEDVSFRGESALAEWDRTQSGNQFPWACEAAIDVVRGALEGTGYPVQRLHYIAGSVETTIPDSAPDRIALLRLDTDWYESTAHELHYLFPRLEAGGVLIIDDYGHWSGARKAVDEYIRETGARLLLNRIDYTGRIAVKMERIPETEVGGTN